MSRARGKRKQRKPTLDYIDLYFGFGTERYVERVESVWCDCNPFEPGFFKRQDGAWVRPCCNRVTKEYYERWGDAAVKFTPEERERIRAENRRQTIALKQRLLGGHWCIYCGDRVSEERVEIGMYHCTKRECVAEWRRRRIEDNDLALTLVPKQGMAWITKDHASENNKSSGR